MTGMGVGRRVLSLPEWGILANKHRARVATALWDGLVEQATGRPVTQVLGSSPPDDFFDREDLRAELSPNHPVFNFIRAYFGIKEPKQVRRIARFSPGPNVLLQGANKKLHANQLGASSFLRAHSDGITVVIPADKVDTVLWYKARILAALSNPPILHCFGLHEWAMLYHPQQDQNLPPSSVFQSLPLRVPQEVINHVVEERGVYCTHFDAMRFFAPASIKYSHNHLHERSLNKENPACLHAAMDLFNIAYKLGPLVPSSLFFDCLEIALQARKVDVSASPYDVSSVAGLEPIPIETAQGKREYQKRQRELMSQSQVLRKQLCYVIDTALNASCEDQTLNLTATLPL